MLLCALLDSSLYVAELFHGPTLAFKDFGQQLLIRLLNFFCERKRRMQSLLVATTGDTGPVGVSFSNSPILPHVF
jgi:threonine synthase